MARTNSLPNFLSDVADAIRAKTGSSAEIQAEDFDTEISNITTGEMTEEEYLNALSLSEEILDVIGEGLVTTVGPVLNDILDVETGTDTGGSVAAVEAVLDDILGGGN